MTEPFLPPHSDEHRQQLEGLIQRHTRTISLDALTKSGRTEFRVVRKKDLLKELFDVVDVFLENQVKRAEREMSERFAQRESDAREDGKMRVLSSLADLGDLVDNMIATLAGSDSSAAGKALDKRLDRIFKNYEFERIPTVGHAFDPEFHEAIDEESSETHAAGVILRELGRGYRRGAFVLRVARVCVSTGTGKS
jgi:molecular chaperone GrpE